MRFRQLGLSVLFGTSLAISIGCAQQWLKQQVDSCDCPFSISVAVTRNGTPCVAYGWRRLDSIGLYTYGLRCAWREGESWHIETVDSVVAPYFPTFDYPVLCLDTQDQPHILYQKQDSEHLAFCYAERVDSLWRTQVIDSFFGNWPEAGGSMALDVSGVPHVAYTFDSSSGSYQCRYARRVSDTWQTQVLWRSDYQKARCASIDLTSGGAPRIAFCSMGPANSSIDSVLWMWPGGSGWQTYCVDTFQGGWGPTAKVDTSGLGHLVYVNSFGVLTYAVTDGESSWTEGVDDCGWSALYDLKLDSRQCPCVALIRSEEWRPLYLYRDPSGAWHTEQVEVEYYAPLYSVSLALSSGDAPFLAYWLGYPLPRPWGFFVAERQVGLEEVAPKRAGVTLGLAAVPAISAGQFRFLLSTHSPARLSIYSSSGERIASASVPEGYHILNWEALCPRGRLPPPGAYFARLDAPDARLTQKIILLR